MEFNEIFWSSLFNFGILVLILRIFAWPGFLQSISTRSQTISKSIDEAQADYTQAETEFNKWQSKFEGSKQYAKTLEQDAQASLEKIRETTLAAALKQAERIEADSKLIAESECTKAKTSLQQEIVEISTELVRDYFQNLGETQKGKQNLKSLEYISG